LGQLIHVYWFNTPCRKFPNGRTWSAWRIRIYVPRNGDERVWGIEIIHTHTHEDETWGFLLFCIYFVGAIFTCQSSKIRCWKCQRFPLDFTIGFSSAFFLGVAIGLKAKLLFQRGQPIELGVDVRRCVELFEWLIIELYWLCLHMDVEDISPRWGWNFDHFMGM
jgi:hypothetical protein